MTLPLRHSLGDTERPAKAGAALIRLPVVGHSMWPTLRPGDTVWVRLASMTLDPSALVVLRSGDTLFVHRFLGYRRCGSGRCLLAKGDGHWAFDPLWPEKSLFGVVVAVERNDRCLSAVPERGWRKRLLLWRHRLQGEFHRRLRWLFILFLCLGLIAPSAHAAVHLVSFTVTWQGQQVLLQWETASEIDTLGFNLYRRVLPSGADQRLNKDIIPAQGDLAGATYRFLDRQPPVVPAFSYRLEEVTADGNLLSFTPLPVARPTSAPTPRPTATATVTVLPTATQAPAPTPLPPATATPALLPASASRPTAVPTATPTAARMPTSSPTATGTPTSSLTPTSSPTAISTPTSSPTPTLSSTATCSLTSSLTPIGALLPVATAKPGVPAATRLVATPSAALKTASSAVPGRDNGRLYALVGGLGLLLIAGGVLLRQRRE